MPLSLKKIIVPLLILFSLNACVNAPSNHLQNDLNNDSHPVTTIFLFRHAEKVLNGDRDPALTVAGQQRAQQWSQLLKYQNIAAVYSTDYIRTRDTAAPIAASQNLQVRIYNAKDPQIESIAQRHRGESIVVVGHSNTIPSLVNTLVKDEQFSELSEKDYDNVFVVQVSDRSHQVQRLFLGNNFVH